MTRASRRRGGIRSELPGNIVVSLASKTISCRPIICESPADLDQPESVFAAPVEPFFDSISQFLTEKTLATPATTRSARGCHPCVGYDLGCTPDPLPMCPVRTRHKSGGDAGIRTLDRALDPITV